MSNTYQQVSQSVLALLKDKDHKVVALRGKWGTGKTFLWKELAKNDFFNERAPIYVSLFGVRSIKELKLRMLQSVAISDESSLKKIVETGTGIAASIVKRFTGYSAEDGAVLWVPNLVKDRLIVIDDLERKHSTLDTDEVMGFLSEYSETHGAQFLVLLNLEKLSDNFWATLHEKVIDGEVVLDPSAEEAFDIALSGDIGGYVSFARAACSKLKLTNIRVIRRILRVLKKISQLNGGAYTTYERWVPSTVLLVAIHYRAIENPPTFEFIKSFNAFEAGFREATGGTPDDHEAKWAEILTKLGIEVSDDYEHHVSNYLQSGLLDETKIADILKRYQSEFEHGNWYEKRRGFIISYWWDPTKTGADLRNDAFEMVQGVEYLSPKELSDLVEIVDKLGDDELSLKLVDNWLAAIDGRVDRQNIKTLDFSAHVLERHKKIKDKIDEIVIQNYPPLSLVDAVIRIAERRSFGTREKEAIEGATISTYEDSIRSLKLEPLQEFVLEHLNWHGDQYGNEYFPTGLGNFIKACRNICALAPDERLAFIIKSAFESRGKSQLLLD